MLRAVVRLSFAVSWFLLMATVHTAAENRVAPGTWGGEHAVFTVTAQGATLELDCGNAVIDQPISVDRSGNFRVEGTLQVEHAGPVRRDESSHGQRATFEGQVAGEVMTLSMQIGSQPKQTFHLKFQHRGRLMKCR